jgi:hypothetical protein
MNNCLIFFAGLSQLHKLDAKELNDLLLVLNDVSKDMNNTAKDWRDYKVPYIAENNHSLNEMQVYELKFKIHSELKEKISTGLCTPSKTNLTPSLFKDWSDF